MDEYSESGMDDVVVDNGQTDPDAVQREGERQLVQKIQRTIAEDKKHHADAFKRMRKSMKMTFDGFDDTWNDALYHANFAGRHVKQKTNALYAKNPKIAARRAERLEFKVWDEDPASLLQAQDLIMQGQMLMAQTGGAAMPPEMVAAAMQMQQQIAAAQALVADYTQGMTRRRQMERIGRTLEILFKHAMRDQEPLDFKMAMKAVVRRVCTCAVGYVELGFVRENGPRPGLDAQLADVRGRLDHLRRLSEELAEGEYDENSAEIEELQQSLTALQAEPDVVLREGLVVDFPGATQVIPDKMTRQLIGFVGARHLTIEYSYTVDQVREMFGVDLKKGSFTPYSTDGVSTVSGSQLEIPFDNESTSEESYSTDAGDGLVRVWKHYDKMSGLVYYVADGHSGFLRPPAAPDVFVEKFWPVFALTFNATENDKHLFPKSDVELLASQQMEHNRSRQGMREHREAARPRFFGRATAIDEKARESIEHAKAFDVVMINGDPDVDLQKLVAPFPMPGVDPNLYQTEPYFSDVQIVVGAQEAQFGGVSKATATESTIAANSTMASDDSSKDDLDDFLSMIARAGSQILLGNMSVEKVQEIVGPGAEWPDLPNAQIANEVFLEVEAGSSGRPNQAVEIQNFTQLAPILMQIPEIDKTWLAKEAVRRLDDRLDINEAIKVGAPSIVAQNNNQQVATGDPATDPAQQGAQGVQNAELPPGQEGQGTGPSFGSNQVERPTL